MPALQTNAAARPAKALDRIFIISVVLPALV
jgi:hypothetical protein